MFPIKPLLDRVIVREIPVKEYFRVDELVSSELLERADVKALSDRGVVEAVGSKVEDVKPGDTVMFDEFARNDEIYLNPADKNRSDLPRYFRIREADLQGVMAIDEPEYTKCPTCRLYYTPEFYAKHQCVLETMADALKS